MVTTTSGAILIAGRFPGTGLEVSWDDGFTWDVLSIDTPPGGNGAMLEVSPDVVVLASASYDMPTMPIRLHRLRVDAEKRQIVPTAV